MATIQVEGLSELRERMRGFPDKYKKLANKAMQGALLILWESVPGYPPPPPGSEYRRTGTLGRTLGASGGTADIYEVREAGGYISGEFGTRLHYAPYVIGENQAHQNSHWWKLSQVATKAAGKIEELFGAMADELSSWLDGKGL